MGMRSESALVSAMALEIIAVDKRNSFHLKYRQHTQLPFVCIFQVYCNSSYFAIWPVNEYQVCFWLTNAVQVKCKTSCSVMHTASMYIYFWNIHMKTGTNWSQIVQFVCGHLCCLLIFRLIHNTDCVFMASHVNCESNQAKCKTTTDQPNFELESRRKKKQLTQR